jgi:hypothetical protein
MEATEENHLELENVNYLLKRESGDRLAGPARVRFSSEAK